jgi:Fe-S-cluster-containing dehydrogenase component/anaerobic selenocysteine-containing dehydrogenase
MERSTEPPSIPQIDGRVARVGRGERLEKIVPYVRQPEELLPGEPLWFATAMTLGGFAAGLLVESHEGRPTKIEGNPDHPFSLGATNVFHQAAVLELYDPDRSRAVLRAGEVSSWGAFLADLASALAEQKAREGAGLRILTETVTSPTLAAQLEALLKKYPRAKWHQYEPVNRDNLRTPGDNPQTEAHYDFSKAQVVVSLDSDFLFAHPASLKYAREFARARRAATEGAAGMNRLYVAEPTPTITGSMADHRQPVRAGEIEPLAGLLQGAIRSQAQTAEFSDKISRAPYGRWLNAVARDLRKHRGAGIVLAGEGQPPAVHEAVRSINESLGNVGQTVFYRASAEARPTWHGASLKELTGEMQSDAVDLLVMLGGNPVYNAPVDLSFADAMKKVRRCVQLGLFYDETSAHCHWHIPQAHFLESWGDALAFDGTASIIQPLIEPLYQGKSVYELVEALLLESSARGAYDIVRDHWRNQNLAPNFEKAWRKAVHDGVVANFVPPANKTAERIPSSGPQPPMPLLGHGDLELVFRPDPCVWDGRFANNGWLQELPKPITKLTWDNAALVSPSLAQDLGLSNEDAVELYYRGRTLRAAVWIMPGQAERSVTLHLGYGRNAAGRVGNGQGANAYALRTSDAMHFGSGLELVKIPGLRWPLAVTQRHQNLEGRDLYRAGPLEEFRRQPNLAPVGSADPKEEETLYPSDHSYSGYAWGMAIDLNTCIGCNACVIACQSENNIPIVGKGEVIREREMHWIRVDSYYQGSLDNPVIGFQPVPCMHCENAPCEVVCPVEATLHSPEGLNEQVYNRCIGTRYCSNNCPYKVRRFNFLQWADNTTLSYKLQRNPDVTVRSRGVMEKCTYCVQRINAAKITSEKEDRKVRDGEIQTACQQACPTEAIVFGDINDPTSRVAKLRAQPRNYGMLAELNTRPRTTYQAKLLNPNEELNS